MEPSELLKNAVHVLERLGISYFVTGSVATTYFGEPRFTHDIDIVADLPVEKISDFCKAFPAPDYYLSEEAVRQAVRDRGQFNIIHVSSGLKVDVIVPQDSPFNRARFARRIRLKPTADYDASFSSVEDIIGRGRRRDFERSG